MSTRPSKMDMKQLIRRNAAFHEAGHPVALNYGRFSKLTRKISIVPEGDGVGHTEVGFVDFPDKTPSRDPWISG